jgi:hypothetical protein
MLKGIGGLAILVRQDIRRSGVSCAYHGIPAVAKPAATAFHYLKSGSTSLASLRSDSCQPR